MKFKKRLIILYLLLKVCTVSGQDAAEIQRISASQAGASPLYFIPDEEVSSIVPGLFFKEDECKVRSGLKNFFTKIRDGKAVTVGFIGGSITQAQYCYRMQTAKFIADACPMVNFKWLNAGISGTGTDLGACRINEQLLQYNPDLIFIEFAVNGAYASGMEGMVRQIIRNNPATDICFVYTVLKDQINVYQKGGIPSNIQRLEEIARHYQLPSVHLGMEAAQMEKDSLLVWKGKTGQAAGKILFSEDGIHPVTSGGNIYAAAIARGFIKMKTAAPAESHPLPQPLLPDNWEDAKMLDPMTVASFDDHWKRMNTKEHDFLKQFAGWFPYITYSEKANSSFSFRFKGTAFGLFDIGGPEAGQLHIVVDGQPIKLEKISANGYQAWRANQSTGDEVLNRFNRFCNNRYRGQYDFVELKDGVHTVTITISAQKTDKKQILGTEQLSDILKHPERYEKTALFLGKILLRGVPAQ